MLLILSIIIQDQIHYSVRFKPNLTNREIQMGIIFITTLFYQNMRQALT